MRGVEVSAVPAEVAQPLDVLAGLVSGATDPDTVDRSADADSDHITRMCGAVADARRCDDTDRIRWAREYLLAESRTKAVVFAVALLFADITLRECADDAEWRPPERLHDIAGRFGRRVVALEPNRRDAVMAVVQAEYPGWAETLAQRADEVADPGAAFDALADALQRRAAGGWTASLATVRFLEAVVDRHGLARAYDELPAIEHALNPVAALRQRLERLHLQGDVPPGLAEPSTVVLRGGGWSLTWVRWARGHEQIEALRSAPDGSRECLQISVDTQGRWFGDYVLHNAAGRRVEAFEVWKVTTSGEAFASLNRRRLLLVAGGA